MISIPTIYEAFVYKWTNISNNRIYIGKHKGTIDDGYISSGKAFLHAYEANPSLFARDIIWYGTDSECLYQEWQFIKEAISMIGYSGLYNKTHWNIVKQWKRTCMACGEWCDPANEEWALEFETYHFENCSKSKIQNVSSPEVVEKYKILIKQAKERTKEKEKLQKYFKKLQQSRIQVALKLKEKTLIIKAKVSKDYYLSMCTDKTQTNVVKKYFKTLKYNNYRQNVDSRRMKKWLDKNLI